MLSHFYFTKTSNFNKGCVYFHLPPAACLQYSNLDFFLSWAFCTIRLSILPCENTSGFISCAEPSADELRRLMMLHGGQFHVYYSHTKTTHIIATNLPNFKIKELRGEKVVRPEWITDRCVWFLTSHVCVCACLHVCHFLEANPGVLSQFKTFLLTQLRLTSACTQTFYLSVSL